MNEPEIKILVDNYLQKIIDCNTFVDAIAKTDDYQTPELETFETMTTEELLDREFEQIEWIAEDYIPLGGCVLLSGEPKSGKSIIALDLCGSIIGKSLWLSKIQVQGGKIFYIDAENPEILIQDRLRIMHIDRSKDFHIINRNSLNVGSIDLTNAKTYIKIKQKLKELDFDKRDLIVFDSLRRLHSGEENDSTAISKVMALINGISPATKLVLHHLRKKNQFENNPNDRIRGSVDILAAVDGNIAVTTEGTSDEKITTIEMSAPRWSEGQPPFDVKWKTLAGSLALREVDLNQKIASISDIGRMLSETREPLTVKEIAEKTHSPHKIVLKALATLVNENHIKAKRIADETYYVRK